MENEDIDITEQVGRMRQALPEVTAFLRVILDETETVQLKAPQATARGLLDRTACWLMTLYDLTKAQHFQAHAAGLRAMIELTVDLGLLCADQAANERIEAWELSAKWKHAELTTKYEQAGGALDSTRVQLAAKFYVEKLAEVATLRTKFWNGKHPNRWTGRTLVDDATNLDGRYPNLEIRRFYEEQYRWLCMTMHGSGLAMIRSTSGETILAMIGVSLYGGATLGIACAEFALRILGLFNSEWQVKLQRAREDWIFRYGGIKAIR